MRKTILLYGVILAALIFILKLVEYNFLVRDLSLEFYIGFIAVMFTALGIWGGIKLTSGRKVVVQRVDAFVFDELRQKELGISKRELEVLELMASGLSNQEIADKLFVSLNTVKTHTSNLLLKLESRRRTQAIQRAKELSLIP